MKDWDPKNKIELTDGAMVRDIDGRIRELAELWCNKGLRGVPMAELHAALDMNVGTMPWFEFCRDCNIPNPTDQVKTHFYETAWDAFREQCLDWYRGAKR